MNPALESLRFKKFPVLDRGFVRLMDCMGTDKTAVDRARGTTGTEGDPEKDRTLLRMMMRHHHGSSFEFPELDLEICCPFVVWRQMIRHRAGNIYDDMTCWDEPSVNELSGRYSEVTQDIQETAPGEWRRQSKSNRQGSGDFFHVADGEQFTGIESMLNKLVSDNYRTFVDAGMAKEQARKIWPMGGYTTGFMKMDLRNWFHWCLLRLAPDAQSETRAYAEAVARKIIAPLFPATWEAFEDYQLNAMTLSRPDQEVVVLIAGGAPWQDALESTIANKRERDECRAKLDRLGLIGRAAP